VTDVGLLLTGYQDRPGSPGGEFVHRSDDGAAWQHCWTDPLGVLAVEPFGDSLVTISGTGVAYTWNAR